MQHATGDALHQNEKHEERKAAHLDRVSFFNSRASPLPSTPIIFRMFVVDEINLPLVQQFRATLTGGMHRLRAITECSADFELLVSGKETRYDWENSPFSKSRPPTWLKEVPATLHFFGGVDDFLRHSVAIGQAQNDLHEASSPSTYYDIMFYIKAMR